MSAAESRPSPPGRGDGFARELFGSIWTRDTDKLPPAWATAIHGYAAHLRASNRTDSTAYGYARNARTLAQHCADSSIEPWQVTAADLDAWLFAARWSRPTRHRMVTAVRGFYTWAIHASADEAGALAGRLTFSPAAGFGADDHRAPGPSAANLPPAWAEPMRDYTTHLRAGARAEGTITRYRERITSLAQLSADPWSVTVDQLEQWLTGLDWAPETKRAARATVRGFYTWAVRTGRVDRSPAEALDRVMVPRAIPRPIPEHPLTIALAHADDRLRLVLLLAALAGLRRAEIAALHWRDVEHGHSLVVRRGKGGHDRRVPLHPDLAAELLAEWTRRSRGSHGTGFSGPHLHVDGYVFASSQHPGPVTPRWLGRTAARALPDHWTLHPLRHRFATSSYAATLDIRAVQELLGHTRPESTARYAAAPTDALTAAVMGAGLPSAARPPQNGPSRDLGSRA